MEDLQLVIKTASNLEKFLRTHLNAKSRGLGTKTREVADQLPITLQLGLIRIADIRNAFAHPEERNYFADSTKLNFPINLYGTTISRQYFEELASEVEKSLKMLYPEASILVRRLRLGSDSAFSEREADLKQREDILAQREVVIKEAILIVKQKTASIVKRENDLVQANVGIKSVECIECESRIAELKQIEADIQDLDRSNFEQAFNLYVLENKIQEREQFIMEREFSLQDCDDKLMQRENEIEEREGYLATWEDELNKWENEMLEEEEYLVQQRNECKYEFQRLEIRKNFVVNRERDVTGRESVIQQREKQLLREEAKVESKREAVNIAEEKIKRFWKEMQELGWQQ